MKNSSVQKFAAVGPFYYNPQVTHQRLIRRLKEIVSFFDEATIIRMLVPVATANFDISLRLLDYCCTNYAKKTRVAICEKGRAIHLFSLYKDWLRHYRRRCFDPFRRRERICFCNPLDTNEWLDTTVAQLNFLRWAEIYRIIPFVRCNMHIIEQDMMLTLSESKKRRVQRYKSEVQCTSTNAVHKRKRTELSKAPRNKCTVYLVPGNLTFHD